LKSTAGLSLGKHRPSLGIQLCLADLMPRRIVSLGFSLLPSAGIGRTGVLVTMETAMCLIERNLPVYPLDIVRKMRDQRAMMVQTSVSRNWVIKNGRDWLSIVAYAFSSVQKTEAGRSLEFEAFLVYIRCSRPVRVTF
jgi:hypothetical protein